MNMMFLNSLEKKAGDGRVSSAQVSIGEEQGSLWAGWSETLEDGTESREAWYEGTSREDMLSAFRANMFNKHCEGFAPMLNIEMTSEAAALDKKSVQIQLLHYYSEMNRDEELFEELRQWRLKRAAKEGKSPFLVATNRLLSMISAFLPQTIEELKQLPGMGDSKLAAYSEEMLGFTQSRERATLFPLNWVESRVDPAQFNAWIQAERDRKAQAEQNKRDVKRKLLEAITRGDSLDALHEQTQLQRRDLLIRIEELDREGYDLDGFIEKMLENIPAEEQNLAWSAFELQGERYLKPILEAIYNQEELKSKEIDRIYEWLRFLRMKFRRVRALRPAEAG